MNININNNKLGNIESSIDNKNPQLKVDDDEFNRITFYFEDFYDPKKLNSFIKKCEKMFRASDQYSSYIGNLKNDKGLHFCAVRGNITDEDVDIEFHHYPFTLYDITKLVIYDYISNDKKFTSFTIVNELIKLHSNNFVGLVPLCITEHQLVHEGVRSISIESVFGDVNSFISKYGYCMDDDMIEKYNKLIKVKIKDKRND